MLLNTGKIFVLYDNGDGVSLASPENMKSEIMLGDASYVGDYTYTTDIDEQTYNSIKLARPNEKTGRADVFVTEDSENVGKWESSSIMRRLMKHSTMRKWLRWAHRCSSITTDGCARSRSSHSAFRVCERDRWYICTSTSLETSIWSNGYCLKK